MRMQLGAREDWICIGRFLGETRARHWEAFLFLRTGLSRPDCVCLGVSRKVRLMRVSWMRRSGGVFRWRLWFRVLWAISAVGIVNFLFIFFIDRYFCVIRRNYRIAMMMFIESQWVKLAVLLCSRILESSQSVILWKHSSTVPAPPPPSLHVFTVMVLILVMSVKSRRTEGMCNHAPEIHRLLCLICRLLWWFFNAVTTTGIRCLHSQASI